ncbi:MAG: hypothetical protein HKP41_19080 [Desulfobacterales bacterium]|nr:hypothetical protein [Desulfobacterales bacterium]
MKKLFCLVMLVFPTIAYSQNYPGMNQGDMQKMMQQMKKVQQCMEGIDQSQLNDLQMRAEQMKREIDTLCAQGSRSKAQKTALSFSKEIAKDPSMNQMRKCGELAQGAIPNVPTMYDEKDMASKHVCDQ